MTVETERLGHARQIIMHLTPAEVSSYDGIVAVRHPLWASIMSAFTHIIWQAAVETVCCQLLAAIREAYGRML